MQEYDHVDQLELEDQDEDQDEESNQQVKNEREKRCIHLMKRIVKGDHHHEFRVSEQQLQMTKVVDACQSFLAEANQLFAMIDENEDVTETDMITTTEDDFVVNMKRIMFFPPPRPTRLDSLVLAKVNDELCPKNDYVEFFVKRKHRGKMIY